MEIPTEVANLITSLLVPIRDTPLRLVPIIRRCLITSDCNLIIDHNIWDIAKYLDEGPYYVIYIYCNEVSEIPNFICGYFAELICTGKSVISSNIERFQCFIIDLLECHTLDIQYTGPKVLSSLKIKLSNLHLYDVCIHYFDIRLLYIHVDIDDEDLIRRVRDIYRDNLEQLKFTFAISDMTAIFDYMQPLCRIGDNNLICSYNDNGEFEMTISEN